MEVIMLFWSQISSNKVFKLFFPPQQNVYELVKKQTGCMQQKMAGRDFAIFVLKPRSSI